MNSYEREIELLRSLHYALELPVRLVSGGKTVFSMPEGIVDAAAVGENEELSALPFDGGGSVQYLTTTGGENHILMPFGEDSYAAIGPFLSERPSENFVTNLARSGKIKLKNKAAMQRYYDTLPLLSEQRFFYSGKLAESLFAASHSGSEKHEDEKTPAAFIQSEYYQQAKDYRLRQFLHSPYIVEQEICRTISNGDTQAAHRILKEINSRPRARLAGNAIRSLKNSIICSCSFMTRAAISGGVSPDEAFTLSDTYIQRIENCTDVNALLKFEDEMVNGFTLAVKGVKSKRYSNAVTQALSYIDAHLCEPITVKSIADAVYLSPNYLSGLFVRETGETVHNCVIRRRIEEASYFVRSGTDPIADIASFYQFSSQSHFVQSFKHVMGVTPGAYRRIAAPDAPIVASD